MLGKAAFVTSEMIVCVFAFCVQASTHSSSGQGYVVRSSSFIFPLVLCVDWCTHLFIVFITARQQFSYHESFRVTGQSGLVSSYVAKQGLNIDLLPPSQPLP